MAHVEAYIDFSEDENIEDGVLEASENAAAGLLQEIQVKTKIQVLKYYTNIYFM